MVGEGIKRVTGIWARCVDQLLPSCLFVLLSEEEEEEGEEENKTRKSYFRSELCKVESHISDLALPYPQIFCFFPCFSAIVLRGFCRCLALLFRLPHVF